MNLTQPIPFDDAIAELAGKPEMPSELNSREMQVHTSADVRERGFFSARVISARLLSAFKTACLAIVDGTSDKATQRLRLQELGRRLQYRPERGKEGSLEDLFSNARIDVMLDTNVSMVRNFGAWQQGNRPGALMAFPAQQLIRVARRVNKREWAQRWNDSAGTLGSATTATRAFGNKATDFAGLNAFALKNDPIWPAISRFGLPYPPFDYGSGMGLRDVGARRAVELGLMAPGQNPIAPAPRRMNDGLQASVAGLDDSLTAALADGLSAGVELVDGILRFSNEASRARCQRAFDLVNEAPRRRAAAVHRLLQEASWN